MSHTFSQKELVVPANVESLPMIRNFISGLGDKYQFTTHEINAFKISVDEAVTNIIKHGYKDKNSGEIVMKVQVKDDRLVVELIDQGKSFDPRVVRNPNISSYVQNGKKGGLGIFIMRKFLDGIEYEVTNVGNVLRLTKLRGSKVSRPFVVPITSALRRLKDRLFPAKAI